MLDVPTLGRGMRKERGPDDCHGIRLTIERSNSRHERERGVYKGDRVNLKIQNNSQRIP